MYRDAQAIFWTPLGYLANRKYTHVKPKGAARIAPVSGLTSGGIYKEYIGHARRPTPFCDPASGLQSAPFATQGRLRTFSLSGEACVSAAVWGGCVILHPGPPAVASSPRHNAIANSREDGRRLDVLCVVPTRRSFPGRCNVRRMQASAANARDCHVYRNATSALLMGCR